MKANKNFLFVMAVLSLLSLVFMDRKSLKRFLPGTLFITCYLIIEGLIAEKRKWWWFHYTIKPNFLAELPLIFGPFFAGSLWILKYTFGKFKLYFFTNLIIDGIFTYIIMDWFKKIGYVSLEKITKLQLSIIFLLKSISMYGFQLYYERFFKKSYIKTDL